MPDMGLQRRELLIGLGAAALIGPAVATPAAPRDERWTDARRQREVPLRLRLPAGEGPAGLVIYSHGLGGDLDAGTRWAKAWQQAGLAVLNLQHAGSDRAIFRGGMGGARAAANVEQLLARCEDVVFVLDRLAQLQQEPGWQRLRLDAIGMAGHSFGAQTTLVLAGRRFAGGASLGEPRLRAFAAFSPAVGGARDKLPAEAYSGIGAITRPLLCLTGSLDGDPLSGERSGHYRRQVYEALPPGAKAELWLEGADHMSFGGGLADRPLLRRAAQTRAAEPGHQALIARISSDWWRAWLLGDAQALEALRLPAGLATGDEWRQG